MTPSEKKAREIFGSVLHHTVEEELWRIGDAIEVAERRGFEMAKELAVSLILNDGYAITFQTMGQYRTAIAKNVRSLTHDEA